MALELQLENCPWKLGKSANLSSTISFELIFHTVKVYSLLSICALQTISTFLWNLMLKETEDSVCKLWVDLVWKLWVLFFLHITPICIVWLPSPVQVCRIRNRPVYKAIFLKRECTSILWENRRQSDSYWKHFCKPWIKYSLKHSWSSLSKMGNYFWKHKIF